MKPSEKPWPVPLSHPEGFTPELDPELQAKLQSLLKVCAEEPGPSEEVTRRAARQAVAHFESLESGAGAMSGWLSAALRPGRVSLALAVVMLLSVVAALAAMLSRGDLSRRGDLLRGRHAVHPSEPPPPSEMPSAPVPSISPAPEVIAPSMGTSAPIARAERASARRETSAPAAVRPVPSRADMLAREARLVSQAIALANDKPRAALDLLAGYWREFPEGALRGEAAMTELSARLSLGEQAEALARLDGFARDDFRGMKGTADELRVARLELMAGAGRCGEALPLLDKELSVSAAAPRLRGQRCSWPTRPAWRVSRAMRAATGRT